MMLGSDDPASYLCDFGNFSEAKLLNFGRVSYRSHIHKGFIELNFLQPKFQRLEFFEKNQPLEKPENSELGGKPSWLQVFQLLHYVWLRFLSQFGILLQGPNFGLPLHLATWFHHGERSMASPVFLRDRHQYPGHVELLSK